MAESEQPKREPGLKAEYGEASPEDVARAIFKHRPKPKDR